MNSITQYFLNRGIPEDIFILIFSIPIIFILIIFARRIIGSMTLGIYTPLFLIILLNVLGIKNGAFIFILIFVSIIILRYILRKVPILSMTDTRILDAIMFCILIIIILLGFTHIPFLKKIPFNIATLLFLLVVSSYSEDFIVIWERRKFKQFIAPFLESLILIIVSYFLLNWGLIKTLILEYPLGIILGSGAIILIIARWRGLRIKEYIRFKEVIKNVELPEKK